MARRRLPIDFEVLAEAMENQGSDEYDYYFDTVTGQVMRIAMEVWNALDEGRTIAGSLAGWQQEELREAREIFGDTQGRYILIPERREWEVEELMPDFVDAVAEEDLREKLTSAMDGRNALRRFKDILAHYPAERERWLALQQESDRDSATRWLAEEEIEPVWISSPGM
jgi:predicted dehydrogenase